VKNLLNGTYLYVACLLFALNPGGEVSAGGPSSGVSDSCPRLLVAPTGYRGIDPLKFNMPGLEIASLADPTLSTGATLFFFPRGATANFDARGGSVAAVELQLLEEGSYSNAIDGIVFAGGSTMGLGVTDGVRRVLFRERSAGASAFDAIPSVPGAVVYDFGSRVADHNDKLVYPDAALGELLMARRKAGEFAIGRAGAGVTTTVNKMGDRVWGGQGAAFAEYPWGKVFVAVVLNAVGDIVKDGKSIAREYPPVADGTDVPAGVEPKKNTTLSIVVTDADLDRNQLKRLSVALHTSMAGMIRPFHTYGDGDINFAVSLGKRKVNEEEEFELGLRAAELMSQAMEASVRTANRAR
jgi:L-aminopeptidase/D-esterase-like protein